MNLINLKYEFKKYFETFDVNDKKIELKYLHSNRVMKLANLIASESNFTAKDIELSTIVGLLHDYGRFMQWTKYNTFDDLQSIDHGDLAVELLFPDEIKNYVKKEEYYDEIYDAIKYHNKLYVPNDLSPHNKMICNVVRDADKLDIFYLFSVNKQMLPEDNSAITTKVQHTFLKKESINSKDVKTKADRILYGLAMVFDLNFKYSYKKIKESKLIEKIYDKIENKEQFQKYFQVVEKYIEEKSKD